MHRGRLLLPVVLALLVATALTLQPWRSAGGTVPAQVHGDPAPRHTTSHGGTDTSRIAQGADSPASGAPQNTAQQRPIRPPASFDIGQYQRAVQAALSGTAPGLAASAAQAIQNCKLVELAENRLRAAAQKMPTQLQAQNAAALQGLQQELAACQALDSQARASLLPLMRRSLAEGDTGAAGRLAMELGSQLNPAQEKELVQALHTDAKNCDFYALSAVTSKSLLVPGLATPTERAAYGEVWRWQLTRAGKGDMAARLSANESAIASLLQRPDATEVARLSDDIKSRCKPL